MLAVAADIGQILDDHLLVVVKSTVPVGTCDQVRSAIQNGLDERDSDVTFSVASNPEFLAEGVAINDFMKPDRIVAGVEDDESETIIRERSGKLNYSKLKIAPANRRSAGAIRKLLSALDSYQLNFEN